MGAPSPPSTANINTAGNTLAQTQQGYNVGAQAGSEINQTTPYGSGSWQQTGTGPNGVPTYTWTENLSPTQQGLYNTFTGTQGTAGNAAAALLSGANYGQESPTTAIGDETTGLTGQMMNKWLQGVTPFFTTQQQQLDTQLRNQGVTPGNPAYDVAMRNLDTNQGLAVAQESATVEPNAFNQATTLYGLPASMATQLASFGAPTTPNATFTNNTPQLQPANAIGALSAEIPAYMQPYAAAYQQYGNLMNGLFGLGSAGLTGLTGFGGFGAK